MADHKIINDIRIQLLYDKESNWKSTKMASGSNIVLDSGELALIELEASKRGNANFGIAIGDGLNTINTIFSENDIFYSGVGAGYVLPVAGTGNSGRIGGIKLANNDYFSIDSTSGTLTPTFVSIGDSGRAGHSAFVFKDGLDLLTTGNIYCNTLVGEREVDITQTILQVDANYIGINVEDDDTSMPELLGENEYAGLRFYNFKSGQEEVAQGSRDVAELSINNDGILEFTTNYKNNTVREQFLTLARTKTNASSKYLKATENSIDGYSISQVSTIPLIDIENMKDFSVTFAGNTTTYNPKTGASLTISVDQDFCKTISLADGTTHSLSGNNIYLPIQAFSTDHAEKLNSAVQSIHMNGYNYSGASITLPSFSLGTEETTIEIVSTENKVEFNHKAPTDWVDPSTIITPTEKDVTNLTSNKVILIDNVVYDNKGHVSRFTKTQLDFTTLLSKISELETRLLAAEGRIATLEE